MTYDQWKDPTDYSPDDDSDWLSLIDCLEQWMEASEKLTEIVRELNPGATQQLGFIDFVLARVSRSLQDARDRSDRERG